MNARELRIERKLAEKQRAAKAAPEPDLAIPLAPPENPLRWKVLPSQEEDGLLRNVLALNEGKARLILMNACLKLRGEAAAELHVVNNPFILGAAAKEQEALLKSLQSLRPSVKALRIVPHKLEAV